VIKAKARDGRGKFCSYDCFARYKGETSIEKMIREELERRSAIRYEQEVAIGRYRVDFLLPTLAAVIECDGSYWHNMPGVRKRDGVKDKYLSTLGYQVYRFSEAEIKASAGECIDRVRGITGF
jgi:very-short-patch-repair endonuclease